MDVYKNLIGGRWVEGNGDRFTSYNPATGQALGEITAATPAQVDEAVAAAAKAQADWRRVPAPKRGEILFRAARLIEENKQMLGEWVTREMGKVIEEGLGDVQEAIDMTYYMAGEGRRLLGRTTKSELRDKWMMSTREPVGVAGLITPWNFPIAIPSWKIMPALVAGNTVVLKPASDTPICAAKFVEILLEAGLPEGVINLVYGSGSVVGKALAEHQDVDILSFTGSTASGSKVYASSAAHTRPLHLEMGGKNAISVLEDADLDLAVDGIIWSAFGTTGQRCTATSRLIVHRDVRQELEERLVDRVKQLQLGDGLDPAVDVGPLVNKAALEKVKEYVEIGKNEGARLLVGGSQAEVDLEGNFFEPTIFSGVDRDMRIAQEEIFGPVLSVIEVESLEEAIEVNNDSDYGLSSALYTQDLNRAFKAMEQLTSGLVYINAGTIGAEIHLPFGGTRGTGNGEREAAEAAINFYTEWKSIYVDYSGKLQRAQIDTE